MIKNISKNFYLQLIDYLDFKQSIHLGLYENCCFFVA